MRKTYESRTDVHKTVRGALDIEEAEIKALQERFDMRYKLLQDCNSEMSEAQREHTRIFIDVATLKSGQRVNNWLTAAIAGGIIALVIKVFLGG